MFTRRAFCSAVAGGATVDGSQAGAPLPDAARLTMWYRQPAATWVEALPIGNGRLGAMIFGGVERERLQLNEDTLWSGPPPKDWNNPEAKQYLPQVRRLLMEERKYAEAHELTKKMQGPFGESYEPVGYLNLQSNHSGFSEYRRELDLNTAVARVSYAAEGVRYIREIFASAVDQVIVIHLGCDRPGALFFTASFQSPLRGAAVSAAPDFLSFRGRAPRHVDPAYLRKQEPVIYEDEPEAKSMRFDASIKIIAQGGTVRSEAGALHVEGANSATIYLAMGTGYRGFRNPLEQSAAALSEQCRKQIATAAARPYSRILSDHISDYRKLFKRVTLNLGTTLPPNLPTDERLRLFAMKEQDPNLAVLYYQFGRYLLISCSRPDTRPANLQGIWSDKVRPPWCANYTININTQMNYWPAEPGNLAECHRPLFDLVNELAENGRDTAKTYYGLDGWVAHHNADLWAQSPPVGESGPNGEPRWSNWPMGGAWLCQHLAEHFAYGQDMGFLRQKAYPVLRSAAQFMLGWLIDDGKGHLVTCPSVSPENDYLAPDGARVGVDAGTTMDMAVIRELFTNCIEFSKMLGVDADFRAKLEAARPRLLPFQIGKHGQLQEWSRDFEEGMKTPHVSHLYPLFPGNQITPRRTPKLAQASRVSLEGRIAQGEGGMQWPAAWYINLWARLEEGDKAYEQLESLIIRSTAPSLLNRPSGFQIDANLGATAGIAEMLLQSHDGAIHFLPALPAVWAAGSYSGLRARGALTVDLTWKDGKAVSAELHAATGGMRRLRAPRGQSISAIRSAGRAVPATTGGDGAVSVSLRAGQHYAVQFGA